MGTTIYKNQDQNQLLLNPTSNCSKSTDEATLGKPPHVSCMSLGYSWSQTKLTYRNQCEFLLDTPRWQKMESQDNLARNETSNIHFWKSNSVYSPCPDKPNDVPCSSVMHPDYHWLHKEHACTHAAENSGFKDLQPTQRRQEKKNYYFKGSSYQSQDASNTAFCSRSRDSFSQNPCNTQRAANLQAFKENFNLINYTRVWQHSTHGDLDEAVY